MSALIHGIFDSHAHYDDARFDEDRDALLSSLPGKGVCGIIDIGCDLESSRKAVALAEKYPYVWAAVGYHPEQAALRTDEGVAELRQLLSHPKVVAIGEIGLDYYWPEPDHETQKRVLIEQLELARELQKPVILHVRDASEDSLTILKAHPVQGVMHCFSGSPETAREVLKLGLYIGFTGVLTFKNARKPVEACAAVPLDRLLLETDCPYMAPTPYRGQRCWSPMIEQTAARAAEIKGVSTQELVNAARENTLSLFQITLP